MKKLISFLLRYSPRMVFLAAVTSVVTGLVNTGLLILINRGITEFRDTPTYLVYGFAVALVLLPLSRVIAQVVLVYLAQKAIIDLRLHLSRQMLAAPLRKLEELGPNRLLAALVGDIMTLTAALANIPILCMQATVLVGCFAYLFWLYWPAGVMLLVATGVGLVIYQLMVQRAQYHYHLNREGTDDLIDHFQALTEGTKELKLHSRRSVYFVEEILKPTAESLKKHVVHGSIYYSAAGSFSQVIFFLVIGLSVFLLPVLVPSITLEMLTGYTMILLYLMIPLEGIMTSIPTMGNALISLHKIENMGISLETREQVLADERPTPNWRKLEYQGLVHVYHREDEDREFSLGPIDLTIHPNELIFLVGGNGSGKTTLAKLLMGLYAPEAGQVVLDGKPIHDDNRDELRQYFSAVFSDFFLFEHIMGSDVTHFEEKTEEYLRLLQLDKKVKVRDGKLSTRNLSQGQRKRLALLTAYLENRQIYLFDEWAADQDPAFKHTFYTNLLPDLRARGKTVIVISHDDHYYHVADRIIKLNEGRIEEDRPVTKDEVPGGLPRATQDCG